MGSDQFRPPNNFLKSLGGFLLGSVLVLGIYFAIQQPGLDGNRINPESVVGDIFSSLTEPQASGEDQTDTPTHGLDVFSTYRENLKLVVDSPPKPDLQRMIDDVEVIELKSQLRSPKSEDTAAESTLTRFVPLQELFRLLEELLAEKASLETKLAYEVEELERVKEQVDLTTEHFEIQRTALEKASEEFTALSTELEKLDSTRSEAIRNVTNHNAIIGDHMRRLTNLDSKLRESNQRLMESKQRMERQSSITLELQRQISVLAETEESYKRVSEELLEKKTTEEANKQDLENERLRLENVLKEKDRELLRLQNKRSSYDRHLTELDHLEQFGGEVSNLRSAMHAKSEEIDQLKAELESLHYFSDDELNLEGEDDSNGEEDDLVLSQVRKYNQRMKKLGLMDAERHLEALKMVQESLVESDDVDPNQIRTDLQDKVFDINNKIVELEHEVDTAKYAEEETTIRFGIANDEITQTDEDLDRQRQLINSVIEEKEHVSDDLKLSEEKAQEFDEEQRSNLATTEDLQKQFEEQESLKLEGGQILVALNAKADDISNLVSLRKEELRRHLENTQNAERQHSSSQREMDEAVEYYIYHEQRTLETKNSLNEVVTLIMKTTEQMDSLMARAVHTKTLLDDAINSGETPQVESEEELVDVTLDKDGTPHAHEDL